MNQDQVLFRKWANIIKRLDSVTREVKAGYGLISIRVMVDSSGEPKFWTEPELTKFEPKGVRITDILLELSGIPQIILVDEATD